MRARNWDLGFVSNREFDTKRSRCSTVIRATAHAEIDDTHKPKRAQSRVIETTASVDVRYAH